MLAMRPSSACGMTTVVAVCSQAMVVHWRFIGIETEMQTHSPSARRSLRTAPGTTTWHPPPAPSGHSPFAAGDARSPVVHTAEEFDRVLLVVHARREVIANKGVQNAAADGSAIAGVIHGWRPHVEVERHPDGCTLAVLHADSV